MSVETYIDNESGELLCADESQTLDELRNLLDSLKKGERLNINIRHYSDSLELSYKYCGWAKT